MIDGTPEFDLDLAEMEFEIDAAADVASAEVRTVSSYLAEVAARMQLDAATSPVERIAARTAIVNASGEQAAAAADIASFNLELRQFRF